MRKRTQIITGAVLAIVALIAGNFVITTAIAAGANDSDEALHFYKSGSYVEGVSGDNLLWTTNVIASNSKTSIEEPFSCPAESTGVFAFISDRGSERLGKGSWKAYIVSAFIPGTTNAFQINLKPSGLISGTPGSQVIKGVGGDYSMGVSCTTNDGLKVLYASYRLISVSAGTGAWTAEPAPTIDSEATATQLALSSSKYAIQVGAAIDLTSSLSPAFAGATISFKDGNNSLGSANTDSSGIATLSVSSLTVGSHSITANYAGDATHKTSASSAVTIVVSPAPTTTPTPTPTATTPAAPIVAVNPPAWIQKSTIYQVNPRVFTDAGNFAAFKQQVPRLKTMGVSVINFLPLTPISAGPKHQGTLGSLYAADDYQAVNSEFGTATDFINVVTYLHRNGFKVVVGWNAQATGFEHGWVTDHPTWYLSDANGIITPAGGSNVDKALLNYANADMRLAMIDSLKYWVTTFGVDGFSCANVDNIPVDFWDRATAEVNAVKPTFWLADSTAKASLFVNSFAAAYNYGLYSTLSTLSGKTVKLTSFASAISAFAAPGQNRSMPVNFISNDLINATNGSEIKRLGLAKSYLASLVAFTSPGTPMIYNGQEIASAKTLKAYDKDSIKWVTSPATAFYKTLINLKARNSALWTGASQETVQVITTSNSNVLAYMRTSGSNKVLVIINLSTKAQKANAFLSTKPGKVFTLAGKATTLSTSLKLSLPASGYLVYSSVSAK
jgi:hypothetical protein